MLHSIPYNKYEDGTIKLQNELLTIHFEEISLNTFNQNRKKLDNIFSQLINLQTALLNEKNLDSDSFNLYQQLLDNAFEDLFKIENLLNKMRKKIVINIKENSNQENFKL